MRKVKIPSAILKSHGNAFAAYVEKAFTDILSTYRRDAAYREYLHCLTIDPADLAKKQSIVVRNIKALASVVSAVDSVKNRYPGKDWSLLENSLKRKINYDYRFVNGHNPEKWDTAQYINGMIAAGLVYCPYCNRHPLEAYPSDGKTHKGPLDHFYDKDRYPYLALSIYNLIPVCDQCNHEKWTKRTSLNSHSHPFYDDFHKLVVFSVPDKPLGVLYGEQEKCVITMSSKQKRRSSAALQLADEVKLISRYNTGDGGRIARSVYNKGVRYRVSTIRDLQRLAKDDRRPEDVYTDLFEVRPDGSDINMRHYGKLRNDLMPNSLKTRPNK